jgi:hypothetical protein
MFNKKDEELKKALAPIEEVAGKTIRSYSKSVQEDAWMVAYIAYLEGDDVLEALAQWRSTERKYQKKILAFTRARPLAKEKKEFLDIFKDYH